MRRLKLIDYKIEFDEDECIVIFEEDIYFIEGEIYNFVEDGVGFGLE